MIQNAEGTTGHRAPAGIFALLAGAGALAGVLRSALAAGVIADGDAVVREVYPGGTAAVVTVDVPDGGSGDGATAYVHSAVGTTKKRRRK